MNKYSGIIRPVDKMGRVVIPKEMRNQLNITNDTDSFEIFMEGDSVVLKKYTPACIFCGSLKVSVKYQSYNVCVDCIDKLQELKELEEEE